MLLKCIDFGRMEWIGPAHTRSFFKESSISIRGNRRTWNVISYTDGQSINHNLPHKFRLKLINNETVYDFTLQITYASVMDEGLYLCGSSFYDVWFGSYILKMIGK